MKKRVTNVLFLVVLISMMVFGVTVYAESDSYTVDVPSGFLALRNAKISDDSNVIGKLYSGETVELKDASDDVFWYVYSSKLNASGYVNKNFLLDENGNSVADGNKYSVSVERGFLALRSKKADNDDNIIGELYTGDIVEVRDKQDSTYWYVYSSKYKNSGYVNKNYLIAEENESETERKQASPAPEKKKQTASTDDCSHCFGTGYCDKCAGLGEDLCTCLGGSCPSCSGMGHRMVYTKDGYEYPDCRACGGSGFHERCNGTGFLECSLCDGTGFCIFCNGTGKR